MFSGNYTAKVDNNGRFTFPAKQLVQLGEERKLMVMPGILSEALWLLTKSYWNSFYERMTPQKSPFAIPEMTLKRKYIGNSFDTEVESSSRIVIPMDLLKLAGISDKCTIIGVGDFFELWDPTRLLAQEKQEEVMREKAIRELGGSTKF